MNCKPCYQRIGLIFLVYAGVVNSCYAESDSTEKAKSTITQFLESLEASNANQVISLDTKTRQTTNSLSEPNSNSAAKGMTTAAQSIEPQANGTRANETKIDGTKIVRDQPSENDVLGRRTTWIETSGIPALGPGTQQGPTTNSTPVLEPHFDLLRTKTPSSTISIPGNSVDLGPPEPQYVLPWPNPTPVAPDKRDASATSSPVEQSAKPSSETAPSPSDLDPFGDNSLKNNRASSQRGEKKVDRPNLTETQTAPRRDMDSETSTISPVHTMSLSGVFTTVDLPESRYRPKSLNASTRDPYWGSPAKMTKHWVADNLSHKTLYFEDLRLERHGQSHGDCLQSHLSGFRFLADAVVWPFRMMATPPNRCFYVQCEGRPGVPRN